MREYGGYLACNPGVLTAPERYPRAIVRARVGHLIVERAFWRGCLRAIARVGEPPADVLAALDQVDDELRRLRHSLAEAQEGGARAVKSATA